jgi:putative transposase
MTVSPMGKIVRDTWDEITHRFPDIDLDTFVVMPNHIHGIIIIADEGAVMGGCRGLINQTLTTQPPTTDQATTDWIMMKNDALVLGKVVRYFKAKTTKMIHDQESDIFRWQRNYYEHVIRSENELSRIREYIINNPANWTTDELYCV